MISCRKTGIHHVLLPFSTGTNENHEVQSALALPKHVKKLRDVAFGQNVQIQWLRLAFSLKPFELQNVYKTLPCSLPMQFVHE